MPAIGICESAPDTMVRTHRPQRADGLSRHEIQREAGLYVLDGLRINSADFGNPTRGTDRLNGPWPTVGERNDRGDRYFVSITQFLARMMQHAPGGWPGEAVLRRVFIHEFANPVVDDGCRESGVAER